MKLMKIEIENYKSITDRVCVRFCDGLPTVLIGKNGSGKSNILEALEHIISSNADYPGKYGSGGLRYKAYICLGKDEFEMLFPDEEYSESKATFAAYASAQDSLHIDTVESETVVPLLKREFTDIRIIVAELREEVEKYYKLLQKTARDELEDSGLKCYEAFDFKGHATNYSALQHKLNFFIDQIKKWEEQYSNNFKSDNTFVLPSYYDANKLRYLDFKSIPFELQYKEPNLAPIERRYISIDVKSIKREVIRINSETASVCRNIEELIGKVKTYIERLSDTDDYGALTNFARNVKKIFGQNSEYLAVENSRVLFKDRKKEYDNRYYDASRVIFKAYAKALNKPELLENKQQKLDETEIKAFEKWLNDNCPEFDFGMYKKINVRLGEKNEPVIQLEENGGQMVTLNETSAGRRWYYTYYFIKCTVSEGDTLIIDEPASMLHPSAQKEIMRDFSELSMKGVRIIYSTHSPYLIPDEWNCVGFVSMEEGTHVSYFDKKFERKSHLKQMIGDIFDLESVAAEFKRGDPEKIAKNCYNAIIEKDKRLEVAAKELNLTTSAIESWHRKGKHFRSPKLENVIAVAEYADVTLEALLR